MSSENKIGVINSFRRRDSTGKSYVRKIWNMRSDNIFETSSSSVTPSSDSNFSTRSNHTSNSGSFDIYLYPRNFDKVFNFNSLTFIKDGVQRVIGRIMLRYYVKGEGVKIDKDFKYRTFEDPNTEFTIIQFEDNAFQRIIDKFEKEDRIEDLTYINLWVEKKLYTRDVYPHFNDSNFLIKDGGMFKTIKERNFLENVNDIENISIQTDFRFEEEGDIVSFLIKGSIDHLTLRSLGFKSFRIRSKYGYIGDSSSNYLYDYEDGISYVYFEMTRRLNSYVDFKIIHLNASGHIEEVRRRENIPANINNIEELFIEKLSGFSEFSIFDRELSRHDFKKYITKETSIEKLEPSFYFKALKGKQIQTESGIVEVEKDSIAHYDNHFKMVELGERFPSAESFLKDGIPSSLLGEFKYLTEVSPVAIKEREGFSELEFDINYDSNNRFFRINNEKKERVRGENLWYKLL